MKSSISYLFSVYILMVLVFGGIATVVITFTSGNIRWVVTLVLVGIFIGFSVFTLYIYVKFLKPIRQATARIQAITEGNYESIVPITDNGEMAKLNHSLNILAKGLQEKSVHEDNQDLQIRTVIDNMQSGVVMIDDKGYIQLINHTFLNIFGGEYKDYIGFLYYESIIEKSVHEVVLNAFLYEEKIKRSLELMPSSDRSEGSYIEVVGAPLFSHQHYVKGAVLVFHDITELKKVEEMRKDFVANVSHELKTPITSIRGFAETLLDGAHEDEDLRRQFLSIILTESERLQMLVHDLLELSKLDDDKIQLEYTKININELVQEILPHIQQQAHYKDIKLEVTVDDDVEVSADYGLLRQVILNLLSNAVNYTSDNGEVTLEIIHVTDAVRVIVKDTGIGIPQEMQPRIFERFFRIDRARSRNTGGTGLGLAIVKHIVEAHRGSIEVDSEENVGTSFEIVIPKNL